MPPVRPLLRRSAVVLLLAAGLLQPWSAPAAHACSCVPSGMRPADPGEVVFEGTVTDRHDPYASGPVISSGRPVIWTFAVEYVLAGAVPGRVEVASAAAGPSCGAVFAVGHRFRVVAVPAARWSPAGTTTASLTTSSCSGNRPLPAGPAVAPAPVPTPVTFPPPEPFRWAEVRVPDAEPLPLPPQP
jgi:hypothetical protein